MRSGVTRRLALLFLFFTGCLFLFINTFLMKQLKNRMYYTKEQTMYEEAGILAQSYVERYYSCKSTITELMDSIKPVAKLLNTRIWIAASFGKVVGDTAPINDKVIQLNEIDENFLQETFHHDVYFPEAMTQPMLVVVVPITYEYTVRGYICMLTPMSEVVTKTEERMLLVYWAFLFFLICLLCIFAGVFLLNVLPLKKTIKMARNYSMGSFKKKIVVNSGREYKELSDIINYMGDTVRRFDDYQRKIIANISHDFRSPLTSIKGYAQAMMDGTIPSDQITKYFDVVVFEVERLTKLTNNLLTLNAFDQKGMILRPTKFDVNEEIKGLVFSFEGTCKKKHIVIRLTFNAEATFVVADKEKIEQVLYNLIDNAIKFSHTESEIQVSVMERGKKAMISVKDNGIGIDKESQQKIWDRFYKSDTSRGKDKKGTGLGLSIVKEIITAHKENVSVVSTEGAGTEFVFTLPLALTDES